MKEKIELNKNIHSGCYVDIIPHYIEMNHLMDWL